MHKIESDLYDELVHAALNTKTDRAIDIPPSATEQRRVKLLSDRVNKSAANSISNQIAALEEQRDVLTPEDREDSPVFYWLKSPYLISEDKIKLSAYYHIKNSKSHRSGNSRGESFAAEFDKAIAGKLIQGVSVSTDGSIDYDHVAATVCNQFLTSIARKQLEGVINSFNQTTDSEAKRLLRSKEPLFQGQFSMLSAVLKAKSCKIAISIMTYLPLFLWYNACKC